MERTTKPRSVDPKRRASAPPVLYVEVGSSFVVVRLGSVPTTLGRGEAAGVTIDDEGLSRCHAKFVVAADGDVTVVDLESTNGTFLRGERVSLSKLSEGDTVQLGPDVRATLRYPPAGEGAVIECLTARQLEIARLVAAGHTSAEVGETLGLSARTVDSHVERITKRLGCRGRTGLTSRLAAEGLLPSEG